MRREHPKMYITQPSIKQVKRNMQQNYISRQGNKHDQLQEKKSTNQQHNDKILLPEEESRHSKDEPIKTRKKFIDMNIEERIHYFLSQPSYAPKVKCEIRTEQRKYVGYIQSFVNNQVKMLLPGRKKEITLSLDEIQMINLFGF